MKNGAAQRLELVAGQHRAVIGSRGASLLGLQVDGLDLVQPVPANADPTLAVGATLAPWPNRVRGACWEHRGRRLQLVTTEPRAGNALHGLVTATSFAILERFPDRITLVTCIADEPGYPFALELRVTYALREDGLHVEQSVRNFGTEPAPVALGAHPYLCLGRHDVGMLDLAVSARTTLLLGHDHLPQELISVAGTPYDLRSGSPVGQMPVHAVYTDFTDASNGAPTEAAHGMRHHLSGHDGTLELWADPRLRWLQVYRTEQFPAPDGIGGNVTALAVEPMTAPPDALNSGVDLEWVMPRTRWAVRWGLRLQR